MQSDVSSSHPEDPGRETDGRLGSSEITSDDNVAVVLRRRSTDEVTLVGDGEASSDGDSGVATMTRENFDRESPTTSRRASSDTAVAILYPAPPLRPPAVHTAYSSYGDGGLEFADSDQNWHQTPSRRQRGSHCCLYTCLALTVSWSGLAAGCFYAVGIAIRDAHPSTHSKTSARHATSVSSTVGGKSIDGFPTTFGHATTRGLAERASVLSSSNGPTPSILGDDGPVVTIRPTF